MRLYPALLISTLAAAGPIPNETVIALDGHNVSHKLDYRRFWRIRASILPLTARLYANGIELPRLSSTEWELPPATPPLRITASHPLGRLVLISSPRVSIASVSAMRCAGGIQVTLTARNQLDNTVNVHLDSAGASLGATIPPATTHDFIWTLPRPAPKLSYTLEKAEEAAEGAYTVAGEFTLTIEDSRPNMCRKGASR